MALTELNLNGRSVPHKDVDAPEFGGKLRVTELSVKGYSYRSKLHVEIRNRGLADDDAFALILVANIMSCLVNPDTGDFLIAGSEVDRFADSLKVETFEKLLLAVGELNPIEVDNSLKAKKKKS